jgi:hypothetical protein
VPAVLALRLTLENWNSTGLDFGFSGWTSQAGVFRENAVAMRTGLRLGTDVGRARLFLGAESGLGATWRSATSKPTGSPLLLLGPRAGLRFQVQHRTFITLETQVDGGLAYLDRHVVAQVLPAAVLGIELGAF